MTASTSSDPIPAPDWQDRLAALEAEVRDLRAELRARDDLPVARPSSPATADPRSALDRADEVVGRRHLLQAAGATAAGAVAATAAGVVVAPPADAAAGSFDGNPAVAAKGVGGPGVAAVTDTGSGTAAVEATNDAAAGIAVLGLAGATDGTGVEGRGAPGVRATGTGGPAVVATGDGQRVIDASSTTANAVVVRADGGTSGTGIEATGSPAVSATSSTDAAIGVFGRSATGAGVAGWVSGDGIGVHGYAPNAGTGVVGTTDNGWTGVYGDNNGDGIGTRGSSNGGTGLYGSGKTGAHVRGFDLPLLIEAEHGSRTHLALAASTILPAPTTRTDSHSAGELYFDNGSDLWLCTAPGTPGTWRKLAGPATAGALHVLPTPVRVYDSRPGNPPDDVVKGPLANATSRTIDATHNSSGVPTGATAVLANVTVVNTSANGFLALYRNGIAYPGTSTVNWSTTGAVVANLAVTALDTLARLAAYVPAGSSCDFLLDVIGYWR